MTKYIQDFLRLLAAIGPADVCLLDFANVVVVVFTEDEFGLGKMK